MKEEREKREVLCFYYLIYFYFFGCCVAVLGLSCLVLCHVFYVCTKKRRKKVCDGNVCMYLNLINVCSCV